MLSSNDRERYSRQIVLPGFGEEAQQRLAAGSVLVIGAGGLGSPALLYLAAAGVGRIGFIDPDTVDRTNLHRQVLYIDDDVGRAKVDAAAERLRALNPAVKLEPIQDRLAASNAINLFGRFDVVVDGTDRFETRYLVNDACVLTGRPNVYGSVFRFEGQVAVFNHEDGPCYRCLFPEPPPPGSVPDCAEGGVIGALPGIVGSMQALEAIKIIGKTGHPANRHLLIIDGLTLETRRLRTQRDLHCAVCGDRPTVRELIDYEAFCGVNSAPVPTITATELHAAMASSSPPFLLDVRTPDERHHASIGGLLIPLSQLESQLEDVPVDEDIVVLCRSGKRSQEAARLLIGAGHRSVRNLSGGINAWRRDVDPRLPPA